MTTDEDITENLHAVRDGHTGELAVIPPEADDAWLAMLRDGGQDEVRDEVQRMNDLRLERYPEQVVAALHGDPAVFALDPLTQECIGSVSRVFEAIARSIIAGHDPKDTSRRAAVLLMAGGQEGTPMRCPTCLRIFEPLQLGGPINWDVAGREDIMCPPCWAKQPKHATKPPAPVKAKAAANGTRRRRPSAARSKAVRGAPPDAA